MNIEIIPAMDLIDGACVRLAQGDYDRRTTYGRDPLDTALRFEAAGLRRLHMVDLDGARTQRPANLKVLERIAARTRLEIQYGGGIKSRTALCDVFSAGARRAVCGSIAGCAVGLPLHKYLYETMVTAQWGEPWTLPIHALSAIVLIVLVTAIVAVLGPVRRIHAMSIVDTINAT